MENALNYAKEAVLAAVSWIEKHPGYVLALWVLSVLAALAI